MEHLTLNDITLFVDDHIANFHQSKILSLRKLKLDELIKRKNPYLFKVKNITTSEQYIRTILDAYLSSQEETIFGHFLEKLAIYVCSKTFHGVKSAAEGLDLEFSNNGVRYLIAIKSGPNWGNSSQIAKMRDNFRKAKRVIAQNQKEHVECVNGCCYGRSRQENKGDYIKKCGQSFWEFISNNTDLYIEIIEPLGFRVKERNAEFEIEYSKTINLFTSEFSKRFCDIGLIDWVKIVKYNSSSSF